MIALEGCGALEPILDLPSARFLVGTIGVRECGPVLEARLRDYERAGKIREATNSEVPVALVLTLLERHRLGDGETECIAIAEQLGAGVAIDDHVAANAVAQELGALRVTGTVELLRMAVRGGTMPAQVARVAYACIKSIGAFVRDVQTSFFDS